MAVCAVQEDTILVPIFHFKCTLSVVPPSWQTLCISECAAAVDKVGLSFVTVTLKSFSILGGSI